MSRYWQGICLACTLALGLSLAQAQEDGWPRTLPLEQGLVTIYPLQVDGIDGNVVHYRAALAYRPTAEAEPVFGAGWFESNVAIDQTNRIVHPSDLRVTQTRFPEGTDEVQQAIETALATYSPRWNLDFALDRLETDLQTVAAEQESLQSLNTVPPQIVYRDHPALLVTVDGEPLLRSIENSPYQAVVNTPYPLISDGQHFYLNVMKDVWYRADRATGPYRFEASPPAAIAAMVKPDEATLAATPSAESVTAANAPEIVVATRPTELIVTEGPAVFVPLVDDLLVLQNSDDDVFMHVGSQEFYVVLAGRWYHARSLNGPWAYQAADQLPPAFANIPQDSTQADARVYVAGTAEAKEAALDAQVPQTAAVERGTADIEVTYDGEPDFQPVDGTDLEYAANTGAAVLQSGRQYYLVEDGVWYVSDDPNGPWRVSAWRPQSVSQIAPTSPVYHVKYVYIYDSTPDVVYVGYTPGYLGSYVYHGTVVYGTGWYYRPWVSPYYYYPRPGTWGFHVSYNPWSGWGFGLSWNWWWGWDPYYTSYWSGGYWHQHYPWHHRHYGYWGPRGYRPRPTHPVHRDYGHDRYAQPRHREYGDGYRRHDGNLYRAPAQRARISDSGGVHQRPQPSHRGDRRIVDRNDGQPYRNPERRDDGSHERGGNAPVTPSDLRLKAQIRDANQAAARGLMAADGSGKVYRKARGEPQLQGTAERGPAAARVAREYTPPGQRPPGLDARRRAQPVQARPADQPAPSVSEALSLRAHRAANENRGPQRSEQANMTAARQSQTRRAVTSAVQRTAFSETAPRAAAEQRMAQPPVPRQAAPTRAAAEPPNMVPPRPSEQRAPRPAPSREVSARPSAPEAGRQAPGPRAGGKRANANRSSQRRDHQ